VTPGPGSSHWGRKLGSKDYRMTAKKKPEVEVHDLSKRIGKLKALGGSMSDNWNNILANQTSQTVWLSNSDPDEIRLQRHATVSALIGISRLLKVPCRLAAGSAALERRPAVPDQAT
jgi:hypothetical protein